MLVEEFKIIQSLPSKLNLISEKSLMLKGSKQNGNPTFVENLELQVQDVIELDQKMKKEGFLTECT